MTDGCEQEPNSEARIVNALTIDVEEHFHPNAMDETVLPDQWDALPHRVEANTRHVLDLLDEYGVKATFFVLGWVAERWPRLVAEIARQGHEVASHGFAHRLVYKVGAAGFRADVVRGKRLLEDCLGTPVNGFRAASWSIVASTPWALDILIEEGFTYDSSIFPIHHDIYGIPDFSRFPVIMRSGAGAILEIPPSTVQLGGRNCPIGGGGYLRLFPYGFTRWAIRRLNVHERRPAMVYTHPWEFDVEQPRLAAPVLPRFRQYVNLRQTEPRLCRLLSEFAFAPVTEVFGKAMPVRTGDWRTCRSGLKSCDGTA